MENAGRWILSVGAAPHHGHAYTLLTLTDAVSRLTLAWKVCESSAALSAVEVLEEAASSYGCPAQIDVEGVLAGQVDALEQWAGRSGVEIKVVGPE